MKSALVEIHQQLLKSGLDEEQADDLVFRLLQEESEDFVNMINKLSDNDKAKELYKEIKEEQKKKLN